MKRMIPILLMMTLLLTGCAVPKPATEANTYRQITMQEAVEMMEKEENYIILDVRTHEEFAAGHIPGAIVVPNETIGTEEIAQLPDKDQLIMVYCRSGNRSKQASDKLVKLGIHAIWNFAHVDLDVDEKEVVVENVHLSDSLMQLTYNIVKKKAQS